MQSLLSFLISICLVACLAPLSLGQVHRIARVQEPPAPEIQPEAPIGQDDILRRLEAIESHLSGPAEEQPIPDPCDEWEDVSDQKWTYKVGGRLLGEAAWWSDDANGATQDYAEIRQVRLGLRGTGYGVYDYRIQLDFEPEASDTTTGGVNSTFGSVGMKDLYVGIHEIPFLQYVRFGHFKVPFSFDQMLSRRDMVFMERFPMADPNGFTPGREVGVASYMQSADQNATFTFGGFYDSISESSKQRIDDNQGFVTAARATWVPYYDEPSDGRYLVHLGLGALYVHTQDRSGAFSQRGETHEGPLYIATGPILSSEYTALGSEVAVQWGRFSVLNELMWARVNDVGSGVTNLYSGFVQASWKLTGEHRNYNRSAGVYSELTPYTNFWMVPGCTGIGAWEVAARWSFVDFTEAPNQSQYNSINMALNWYLTPRLRWQLNWNQPFTKGAPLGSTYSSILSTRLAAYF